jgi:hypothetical protein
MEEIPLENWKMLVSEVENLRARYGSLGSELLFRGQSDAEWPLTTTLERNGCGGMLFYDYYKLICANLAPAVKTFAGFDVPKYDANVCTPFISSRELLYAPEDVFPIDLYKYMAYLRHFGFPSPFLDWSRSLGVAAFFAFRDVPGPLPKHRSVFVYSGNPTGAKGGAVGEPAIRSMGPYVQAHKRHFQQRCDYTICGRFDENCGWRFDSHDAVLSYARPKQDFLWKFNLPSSERDNVLRTLEDYNLNAFSLFGSEESLLESLWIQEQVLKRTQ